MLTASTIRLPLRRKARVEIIPLIDVIFFLLATFVLFTLSLNAVRSLPVTLPHSGGEKSTEETTTLQVFADGALFWNREAIPLAELPARLAHYKSQTDNPRVLLTTDTGARLSTAVAVLDEVRKAGIRQFSVETRPRLTGK